MANIAFLYRSLSDTGIFSGGSWVGTMPITGAANPFGNAARTNNTLATSTKFVVDLQAEYPVRMFAFLRHNLTLAGTIRVKVYNAASVLTLDQTIAAPADVVWGSKRWEGFPWETRLYDETPGGPQSVYIHPTPVAARYVHVDIVDTANPDGYVQIHRFMCGDPYQPELNFTHGAQLGWVDPSIITEARSGIEWVDLRPKRRTFMGQFDALTEGEAMGEVYDMMRVCGRTNPLVMVYDPEDDARVKLRRTVYGRFQELTPIETSYSGDRPYTWQFSMIEVL